MWSNPGPFARLSRCHQLQPLWQSCHDACSKEDSWHRNSYGQGKEGPKTISERERCVSVAALCEKCTGGSRSGGRDLCLAILSLLSHCHRLSLGLPLGSVQKLPLGQNVEAWGAFWSLWFSWQWQFTVEWQNSSCASGPHGALLGRTVCQAWVGHQSQLAGRRNKVSPRVPGEPKTAHPQRSPTRASMPSEAVLELLRLLCSLPGRGWRSAFRDSMFELIEFVSVPAFLSAVVVHLGGPLLGLKSGTQLFSVTKQDMVVSSSCCDLLSHAGLALGPFDQLGQMGTHPWRRPTAPASTCCCSCSMESSASRLGKACGWPPPTHLPCFHLT